MAKLTEYAYQKKKYSFSIFQTKIKCRCQKQKELFCNLLKVRIKQPLNFRPIKIKFSYDYNKR